MTDVKTPAADIKAINSILDAYSGKTGILIPLLQDIQEKFNYIPREAVELISEKFHIPYTKITGVITFYAQFRTEPVGKYIIRTCMGTACFVNGGENILDAIREALNVEIGATTGDGLFTLEKVACLGCCSLAPVVMINDEVFGNLTPQKIKTVIENFKKRESK